jgi:tetratricopeptide (TPR) repeat protein
MSIRPAALGVALTLVAGAASAQNFRLDTPKASPRASVSQTIGLTEINVTYDRPAVNDRKIWGGLVPYDTVWRAGANENTVLSFNTPVTIGDAEVAAGRYGVHMVPTTNKWMVIFSNQADSWGAFSYDPKEDELRIIVQPKEAPFLDRLQYTFDDVTPNSTTIYMHWEKLAVPIPIQVNVEKVVIDSLSQQLRGLPRFFQDGWGQASRWALTNTKDLDHAEAWADSALKFPLPTFQTLQLKAAILDKRGNKAAADSVRKQAMLVANENDVNLMGYNLLNQKKVDEAIAIFQKNVKAHPESWNVYDSLGEAYATKGDKTKASTNYKKALSMCPEGQKPRIQGILAGLSGSGTTTGS